MDEAGDETCAEHVGVSANFMPSEEQAVCYPGGASWRSPTPASYRTSNTNNHARQSDHVGCDCDGDDHWRQPPDLAQGGQGTAFAFIVGKGAETDRVSELSLFHSCAFFSRRLVANSGHKWQVVVYSTNVLTIYSLN